MQRGKPKKVRGSAWTEADGTFIFSPYVSRPLSERNLVKICEGPYSSLWLGRNVVSVRLAFDRRFIPPFEVWTEESAKMYNGLVQYLAENEI